MMKPLLILPILLGLLTGISHLCGAASPIIPKSTDPSPQRVQITDGMISVHVNDISVAIMITHLKRKGNLWVRSDPSLLTDTLSMHFDGLPLETGLRRIFGTLNCSLIFRQDSTLEGIILMGRRTSVHSPTPTGRVKKHAEGSSRLPQSPPSGAFTVIKHAPPPDDFDTVPPEDRAAFTVIKNSPPPEE